MAAREQLWIALALVCAAVLPPAAEAQPYTAFADRDRNTITLECRDSFGDPVQDNTVEYRYRSPTTTGSGSVPVPVTLIGDDRRSVEFELTPQTEGEYFCTVNDVESATVELVAFPEQMPVVTAFVVQRGEVLTLNCDFEVGLLSSHYEFRWIRRTLLLQTLFDGMEPISDRFRVFTINPVNSLEITAVEIDDESEEYSCSVTITHSSLGGNPVTENGRNIRVDVFDPVRIITAPSSAAALEEGMEEVSFQCECEGYPAPTIRWNLNGIEVQNESDSGRFLVTSTSSESDSIIRVASTLTIDPAEAQDNGLIECGAMNTNSEGTSFTDASGTSLTVLSTNVALFLTTTTTLLENDPVVYLHFTLPAEFVIPVTVTARYDDINSGGSFERVYTDMFSNAREVDFRIPEVPPFSNFTTEITFSSADQTTDSIMAEPIAVRVAGLQVPSDDSNDIVPIAVGVGVGAAALVAIITVLAIVGGAMYHCKKSYDIKCRRLSYDGRHVRPDSAKELKYYYAEVISVPWQALYSVKDDPWQASWHISARITQTVRTTADTTEMEEVTYDAYVAVDIPWQAKQQEPEALDEPVFWQAKPKEHLLLLYHYRYFKQVVKTYDGVSTTTEHDTIEDDSQTQQGVETCDAVVPTKHGTVGECEVLVVETCDAVVTTKCGAVEGECEVPVVKTCDAVVTTKRGTVGECEVLVVATCDAVTTTQCGSIEGECQAKEHTRALKGQEMHRQQEFVPHQKKHEVIEMEQRFNLYT